MTIGLERGAQTHLGLVHALAGAGLASNPEAARADAQYRCHACRAARYQRREGSRDAAQDRP